ncbi:MAG: hypothetical protein RR202_09130 [Bacteroidales bacterium]
MIQQIFKVKDAFALGWKLTKQHWLVMVGLYLGYTIVAMILNLFSGSEFSARYFIVMAITILFQYLFMAGYTKMYLNAADGEEPEFSAFGQMAKRFLPFFLTSLLFGIATVIGISLLIVPGIWFLVRFGLAPMVIIDKENTSVIEAFKESYRLTDGHSWPILGFYGVSILVVLLGLICLIVGVFLAYVVVLFASVCMYRMLQYQLSLETQKENETVIQE